VDFYIVKILLPTYKKCIY